MQRDSQSGPIIHIADPAFGCGTEFETFLNAILDIGTITVAERKVFLTELFETVYGIKNHVNGHNALSIMEYNESLDYNKVDPLKQYVKEYGELKIHELYGISLIEYLNLTPSILSMIRTSAEELRAKETESLKKLENQGETQNE